MILSNQMLHPVWDMVDENMIAKCRQSNMGVFVWTVNDLAVIKAMLHFGVNGIITDDPLLVREVLDGKC